MLSFKLWLKLNYILLISLIPNSVKIEKNKNNFLIPEWMVPSLTAEVFNSQDPFSQGVLLGDI